MASTGHSRRDSTPVEEWRRARRSPNSLSIWWRLERTAVRAQFQYRSNVFIGAISGVTFQGIQVAFLALLLNQFGEIGGWEWREVGLLLGIRLAAHAVYVVPFGMVAQAERLVRTGEFDVFMARPVNIFIQTITRRFNMSSVGDAFIGVTALLAFALAAPVMWDAPRVAYLLLAVIAGGLVEAALQTAIASMAFVFTATSSLNIFVDNTIVSLGGYPLTMFGRWAVWALTFVMPMAFIAYLPAVVLLGRAEEVPLPDVLIVGSPAIGALLFWSSVRLFVAMARRYVSPSVGA